MGILLRIFQRVSSFLEFDIYFIVLKERVLTTTTAQVPDIAVAGFGVHAFAALRKVTTNMI